MASCLSSKEKVELRELSKAEITHREEVKAFNSKWSESLEAKMNYLISKYGENAVIDENEERWLLDIKWKDVDLKML